MPLIRKRFSPLLAILPIALAGCATATYQSSAPSDTVVVDSGDPELGVGIGEKIDGSLRLQDAYGASVTLSKLLEDAPLVVTFYRGSWCPYCERALTEWDGRTEEVAAAGARFIAITPEAADATSRFVAEHDYGFTVLGDPSGDVARAFEVLFDLDGETKRLYNGYGINLAKSNLSKEWSLPHPGTFILDRSGKVVYRHVTADFKKGRANPDEVIRALKAL